MLKYELKKVLVKPVNRIALLILLAALLIITSLAVGGVSYTESDGSSVSGAEAAAKLRQAKEQWAGYVTDNNPALYRNSALDTGGRGRFLRNTERNGRLEEFL